MMKTNLTVKAIKVGHRSISATAELMDNSIQRDNGGTETWSVEALYHAEAATTLGAHLEVLSFTNGTTRKLVGNSKSGVMALGPRQRVLGVVME